jgi:hypothetical protein
MINQPVLLDALVSDRRHRLEAGARDWRLSRLAIRARRRAATTVA